MNQQPCQSGLGSTLSIIGDPKLLSQARWEEKNVEQLNIKKLTYNTDGISRMKLVVKVKR